MIQIFKELQKETENIKFIKTVEGENTQHYYYEFDGNFDLELILATQQYRKLRLEELSKLKDDRFAYSTVEYKGMITRVRDKDIGVISSMALTGGIYQFENGSLDMERIEFLELAELVNLKRTEIVKWKIEFEDRINSMELIDLYYLNVRARYVK